jgi:broad specificity phosphatase PhoE
MRFYIVRHGESEANVANAVKTIREAQPNHSPLSPKGKVQASQLAERFTRLPVDMIITSDYTRAHQTALTIGDKLGRSVVASELFREVAHPSNYDSWRQEHKKDPFQTFRQAAQKALSFLIKQKSENIIVVTHSGFIKTLICTMAFGDKLDQETYHALGNLLHSENTGITICDYVDGVWKLFTWNDHAHLG